MSDEKTTTRPGLSRSQLWVTIAAVLIVVAVVAGWAVHAALAPDNRSTTKIEKKLVSWAKDRTPGDPPVTARCPDPIEWRVGEDFHCILTVGHQDVGVTVTMENDAGDVTWRAG